MQVLKRSGTPEERRCAAVIMPVGGQRWLVALLHCPGLHIRVLLHSLYTGGQESAPAFGYPSALQCHGNRGVDVGRMAAMTSGCLCAAPLTCLDVTVRSCRPFLSSLIAWRTHSLL
jgi:hypothetical protein